MFPFITRHDFIPEIFRKKVRKAITRVVKGREWKCDENSLNDPQILKPLLNCALLLKITLHSLLTKIR
jgi:hypothetical protein